MNLLERACKASSAVDLGTAESLTKEAMQEVILCLLDRNGFFEDAVFHGGTCLRIVYGLDRFSEDLDFNLLVPNRDFTMRPILDDMIEEFADMGWTPTTGSAWQEG